MPGCPARDHLRIDSIIVRALIDERRPPHGYSVRVVARRVFVQLEADLGLTIQAVVKD